MKQPLLSVALLIVVGVAIFFTNLGTARLWDRDEPRNAGCAAEMLARGDWVVPTFNDELRHQKPVLLYWLIMSAFAVFGQSEFSARFGSATLAIGTVLATFGIGARLANAKIGLLAGLILATSLMFDVAARAATPDSVLIFCGTLAIWIYVAGTAEVHSRQGNNLQQGDQSLANEEVSSSEQTWFPQNWFVVLAFYACLGLGVLAKGPVGFLLPMAMIGWFMLIQRLPDSALSSGNGYWTALLDFVRPFQPTHFLGILWSMRPITGALVVLAIAAPWYGLVHHHTDGDFTQLFFVGEHFGRATNSLEGHGYGIWFYPVAILVGFFPWSVFWWPVTKEVLAEKCSNHRLEPVVLLSLCMIAIQVGVFSLARTKLPSYVTPCYPALALLTAACLFRWTEGVSRIAGRWYLFAFISMMIGGVLVSTGLGMGASYFFPEQRWLMAIGMIPVVGAIMAVWQMMTDQRRVALVSIVISSILFSIAIFGFGTVAVDSVNQSQKLLSAVAGSDHHSILATYRTLESSWVYYAGQPIYECQVQPDNGATMKLERADWWKPKPDLTPEAIVRLDANAAFITTDDFADELRKRLPADYVIEKSVDYFLKKNRRLVLLRRPRRSL